MGVSTVCLMAAPNGARRNKADHPRLPMTADELALEAENVLAAGAAAMHFHVRDADGRHALDAALYREAIQAIRSKVGDRLVLQVTTEAADRYSPAEQIALLRALRPEAVSVALSEVDPDGTNAREIADLLAWAAAERVWPQFILYGPDQMTAFKARFAAGDIPFDPPALLFVLGRYTTGQISIPQDLDPFLEALGDFDAMWSICAFGPHEQDCAAYAMTKGGHVRVGLENNLDAPGGGLLDNTAHSVALAAAEAERQGRTLMDAADLRAAIAASFRP